MKKIKAYICVLVACMIFICNAKSFPAPLSNDANENVKHAEPVQGLEAKFKSSRKSRDIPSTLRNPSGNEINKEPNLQGNYPSDGENSLVNSSATNSNSTLNISSSVEISPYFNVTNDERNFLVEAASTDLESLSPLNYSADSNVAHVSTFSETNFTSSESHSSSETTRLTLHYGSDSNLGHDSTFSETTFPSSENLPESETTASTFTTFTKEMPETLETTHSSLNDSCTGETASVVFDSFKNTSMFAAISGESSAAEHDLSAQSSNFNESVVASDGTSNVVPFNSSHLSSEYSTESIISDAFNETDDYVSEPESVTTSIKTTVYFPTAAVNLTSVESPTNQISEISDEESVCSVCQNCTDSYIDRILSDVTANLPPFLELPNRQGRFQLYHGKLFGLSSLRRSDPAIVVCKSEHEYAVMVPLRIRNAKAFYKWQVEMPLRTFYGDLNVTAGNAESRVFYSHSKDGSLVDNLKITALDDIETEISGIGPMNDAFAWAARFAIGMFRRSIARTMENTLIHVINKELQDVKKYEEYYEAST